MLSQNASNLPFFLRTFLVHEKLTSSTFFVFSFGAARRKPNSLPRWKRSLSKSCRCRSCCWRCWSISWCRRSWWRCSMNSCCCCFTRCWSMKRWCSMNCCWKEIRIQFLAISKRFFLGRNLTKSCCRCWKGSQRRFQLQLQFLFETQKKRRGFERMSFLSI